MRERMERLVLLPFSIGCVSESSVAIGVGHPQPPPSSLRTTKSPLPPPNIPSSIRTREEDEESSSSSTDSMKNKLNISSRFHKLMRNFKTFSQLFEYKEEIMEEMEIGVPTNVKHVTHIGWDDDMEGSSAAPTSSIRTTTDDDNHHLNIMGSDCKFLSSLTQIQLSFISNSPLPVPAPTSTPLFAKPSSA